MSIGRRFHVYILAGRPRGTLYIGVTNDLFRRVAEHVAKLVYFEERATALDAIHREKRLKTWTRLWKMNLIRATNPDRDDLAAHWYRDAMTAADMDCWLTKIAPDQVGSSGRATRAPDDDGKG
ncbi:MAG: GIY-YIG nuclease family protein [Rhizomicrobium sp.]